MPGWIRLVRPFPQTKETVKSMEGKTYCLICLFLSQTPFLIMKGKTSACLHVSEVLLFIISWRQHHENWILNVSSKIEVNPTETSDLALLFLCRFRLGCQIIAGPQYFSEYVSVAQHSFSLNHKTFRWCGKDYKMKFSGRLLISKWFILGFLFPIWN